MHGSGQRHGDHRRGHRFRHHEAGPGFWGRKGGWGDVMYGRAPWAGRRARRGDVRTAVLAVLADAPLHGRLDSRPRASSGRDGQWPESPGGREAQYCRCA